MNPRMRNDCSWIAAGRLLSLVRTTLNEEQQKEFVRAAMEICRELLADYDAKKERETKRLGRKSCET